MNRPREEWPVSNEISTPLKLPERNRIIMSLSGKSDANLMNISRFSKYMTLIRVTARILHLKSKDTRYTLKKISNLPTAMHLEHAVLFWIKVCQNNMRSEFESALIGKGPLRKLCPKLDSQDIYVIGGRAERWIQSSYIKSELPIIHGNQRFSELYARYTHEKGHLGIVSDIAKIRSNYWILGLRKLCKSIKYKCVSCRKRSGIVSSQIMGQLPIERLKPAPAWSYVGVDLFGPYSIRGDVNKRSTGKIYGVIFSCMLTRAVHLDAAIDY